MSEPNNNFNGTFTDQSGTTFSTPDGHKPGAYGVQVTIHQDGQPHPGIWTGTMAQKINS